MQRLQLNTYGTTPMDTPSKYAYKDTAAFAVLLIGLLALLYGKAIGSVGFLSDDWSLIHRAANAPFWLPAEQHHYSVVINLLFKGVALGVLNAASIHVLALSFHAINAFLIYVLLRDVLRCSPWESKAVAVLFAISPAGLEAVVWCCAIGYVLCACWILLGLYVFWKGGGPPVSMPQAWLLAGLQLVAFLCWDWGLVLAPGLAALCFVSAGSARGVPSLMRLRALWPLLGMWLALVAFKRAIGQDFGYAVNAPFQMVSNFVTVPLLGMLPQFTKGFYASLPGMAMALVCFAAAVWTAWKNATAAAMLLLLCAWQLPLVLLGYPQSRYFYLLDFSVYVIAVLFFKEAGRLSRLLPGKCKALSDYFFRILPMGLACAYFFWSSARISWWQGASEQAQQIYEQIEAVSGAEAKPIVVVNMPDRYGPEGMIWLPYLWRCGMAHFSKPFDLAYTMDCVHAPSDISALAAPRGTLARRYPDHALYEVVSRQQGDGQVLLLKAM